MFSKCKGTNYFWIDKKMFFDSHYQLLGHSLFHGNLPDIHRRRHMAVDVAVAFVGPLLVSRKGGDAGGVGGLDDGVEVEGGSALAVGVVAEVGEVEGDASRLPLDAGDEFADLNLILDGVDVDDIVGTGVTGTKAWVEFQFNMEAVSRDFPLLPSVAWQKLHTANKACGEQQTGIVDNHCAVLVGEMLFV